MHHKKMVAIVSIFALLGIASGTLNKHFTGGYKITVQGETIGYVKSSAEYNEALKEINEIISSDFGDGNILSPEAEFSGVLVGKNELSSRDELKDNIARLSGYMTSGYVLSAEGYELCAFKTEKEAFDTLDLLKAEFSVDGGITSIKEDVKVIKKQVSSAFIKTPSEALEILAGDDRLHIVTKVSTVYYVAKDFETLEVPDDSLLIGSRNVTQEGEPGEYAVSAVIEYVNGKKVSKSILSEAIVKEPVNEVISVGTNEDFLGSGEFIMPVSNGRISSGFGGRWGRLHQGIDIAADEGTPIKASDTGVVSFSGNSGSYGYLIKIDHQNGYVTYYAHCSKLLKKEGELVKKGDIIALVGNTGNSTGPHCHFEVQLDGEPKNPMNYVG